ncbi:DUF2330 domain-containing protein [Streptomyces sp. R21]|uniref:DUF2330 domain-containing protein n=1 Tax=Streptomyces sp. R21 TaxID=3238627 RepID=A0AB39PEM8_9ACTN
MSSEILFTGTEEGLVEEMLRGIRARLLGSARGRAHAGARGRVLAVVLALLALQVGSLVAPAYACGCGAMVPDTNRHVTVGREMSVVRWDGHQEQIVMRLTVAGDARTAAWIMPVPHRATVKLGDSALFDTLDEAIEPEHRTRSYFWPHDGDWPFDDSDTSGDAAPGDGAAQSPSVAVVGRERLGPFDVARLTANDSGALGDWLSDNGFELPGRLDRALQPYVDQGWEYVAIRLAPENRDTPLGGTLDPLHLTFTSDTLVYPMRLSRLAQTPQSLGLYVLAAHRMEPRSAIGGLAPQLLYAGHVNAKSGPLAALTADGTDFLTAIDQEFPVPSRISGDHELRPTAGDATYRRVIYDDELLTVGAVPAWLLTVGGALALVTAVVTLIAVRARRRPILPPPPVHAPPPIG